MSTSRPRKIRSMTTNINGLFFYNQHHHHPLEAFVRESFKHRAEASDPPAHNRVTLAADLAGCTGLQGTQAIKGWNAYLTVAEDVLGCMHEGGHLIKNMDGWYLLPPD